MGVRHHGPGSARAVRDALAAYEPKVLLVEGPPEADAVVALAAEKDMRPPVALLAHAVDEPGRAAFWPLADFSPEWVAISWALERAVPVRFFDLPAAHSLAAAGEDGGLDPDAGRRPLPEDGPAPDGESAPEGAAPSEGERGRAEALRLDPLAVLAETAGYDDPERWWEDVVEHRGADAAADRDPYAPFDALREAMGALREVHGDGGHPRDAAREAHMRLRLREARREHGDDGVAVVCGAWHVPALAATVPVTADRQLLKGLPKVKVEVTWVPWTHRRLGRHSGYGAGIASPGWYGHLFAAPDRPVERWMTRVAGLLRAEDHGVSPSHVIEAVRMAETLATVRGRPLAGLAETVDAVRSVMCEGSDVPLALIHDRLIVGDDLGEVPDGAPAVPLQRDLTRLQRSLRLKPEGGDRELELDLRKDTDAARSRLLHRLRLLGVHWGTPARSRTGSTGTFRETWELRWEPELSVRLAEAGMWGTTVLGAATAKARTDAVGTTVLAEVTDLAERCLLADLPDALPVVMRALTDRAALDSDVGHLAQALPPLVRSVRYGDVRGTDAEALAEVAAGLAERVRVGLPPACAGLDADGAAEMRGHLDTAHQAIALLAQSRGEADDGLLDRWQGVLRKLASRDRTPGLVRGRCARLLLDDGRLADGEAARLMGLALSPGTAPDEAAAWIEGFLAGGGMLLVHDRRLLDLVDGWLAGVPAEAFTDVLPLLRRTFAAYESGVRRTVGELVRRGPAGEGPAGAAPPGGAADGPGVGMPGFGPDLDPARADAVLPTLRLLLGRAGPGETAAGPGGTEDAGAGPGTDPELGRVS
ncbi:DUF5682 family protein [Streptomyces sp. Z26]|uniref:DUF5682 family protein n=1 Tax=Streptomyces sp. Z26 TaxID=2500177 RepID=UPI000EF173BC|nr:DUF5682 family protein [Streptomyces sp. Z26]RLL70590.1 hypothetical protein D7M15_18690 [Streptomyces sp. Z26]